MAKSAEEGSAPISAEGIAQLAQCADLALPPERAALLAPRLSASLAAVRALRPDNYDDLQPAAVYYLPREA